MPSVLHTTRYDEVIRLRQTGLSYAKIGSRLDISKARVGQILKGKPRVQKPGLHSKTMLLATGDVSQLIWVHPNTVRRWSNQGILRSYRIGPRGDRRFKREDVERFLKERENKPELRQ